MATNTVLDVPAIGNGHYEASCYGVANRRLSSPQFQKVESAGGGYAERTSLRHGFTADMRPISPNVTSPPKRQERYLGTLRRQSSCSSVKEDRRGTAQSFLESALHGTPLLDQAHHGAGGSPPETSSCSCCCRCGRAKEWKPSGLRAKRKSKSYSPVRTGVSELSEWYLEPLAPKALNIDPPIPNRPGEAPLERLPAEILDRVIAQLVLDIPPMEYTPRNTDLVSCLLTSRTIYAVAITSLHKHVTIPHSNIFSKYLNHISRYPTLGSITKRLDLSHFTSLGLGRTRQNNSDIRNMTSQTLLKCLELTPTVQEVLLQEHLDEDVDEAVVRKLFFGLSNLRAVDFCASSSKAFVDAFSGALASPMPPGVSALCIKRLSLHECFTLPSSTFEVLLPLLPRLTHLDVCHTRVTDQALMLIPRTAGLTHLNVGRCSHISGAGVVDFLITHQAVSGLVYLNLSCDVSRYRLLWEADVDRLLPCLPNTLRSLNLNGAKIRSHHRSLLLPLTKHLEELGIGHADFSMQDVNALFVPQQGSNDVLSRDESNWVPTTLHYLDLTGVPSITQASLFSSSCILLASVTSPLEVLELGDKAISALRGCTNTNKRLGWVVKELGRRAWYVREPTQDAQSGTRGRRSWKMGAIWWGSRKVPVSYTEVGGLYGHYMFKR